MLLAYSALRNYFISIWFEIRLIILHDSASNATGSSRCNIRVSIREPIEVAARKGTLNFRTKSGRRQTTIGCFLRPYVAPGVSREVRTPVAVPATDTTTS